MRFTALDVETANSQMRSICQIGWVSFDDGVEVGAGVTLVDPQDIFSNTWLHGIDEQHVVGAPLFPEVFTQLAPMLSGQVVACHTHFDRISIAQACAFHGLQPWGCRWLDTAMVARRTWPAMPYGYGLAPLAQEFGIEFEHHDALHDARAAGLLLIKAATDSGMNLEELLARAARPLTPKDKSAVIRRPDGFDAGYEGEIVVFTGRLSMTRMLAADLAAEVGMAVDRSVTKHTTLLVVGDQDLGVLGGRDKSSKHIKAERMIAKGHPIRIVGETDFLALAGVSPELVSADQGAP